MANDEAFKYAALYAANGWRVVPAFGMVQTDDGLVCSCYKGENCPSPGKHPVGKVWQQRATTDEEAIYDALDVSQPRNIGIQWGPESKVIDIEFDCEQGKRAANKYGLEKLLTPTYTSSRSTHRILKWSDKLPKVGVIKVEGLEIRIGGDSRGAQSIMPPSIHSTGKSYQWVNGMAPDEVEPADIPIELMRAINNAYQSSGGTGRPRGSDILFKKVGEGERHDHLLQFANLEVMKMYDLDCPVEQQRLLMIMRSINATQCNPPKTDKELQTMFMDCLTWAKRKRMNGDLSDEEAESVAEARTRGEEEKETDDKNPSNAFALSGLEYRDGEWFPGSWTLRVIHGDPVNYILTVPVYREDKKQTMDVGVTLNAEQYRSAGKVAQAILEATHVVIVDSIPEEWARIWNGCGAKKGKPAVRGLKAKLMEVSTSEEATAENCRYAAVAGWFLDVLTQQAAPDEDDQESEPGSQCAQGLPQWVRTDGVWELWFGWERAWELANSAKRGITDGEKTLIKRMLLERAQEDALRVGRHHTEGGVRRRYVRLLHGHLRLLEGIASAEQGPSSVTSYRERQTAAHEISPYTRGEF